MSDIDDLLDELELGGGDPKKGGSNKNQGLDDDDFDWKPKSKGKMEEQINTTKKTGFSKPG
jgi:membrane protein involved in colicin uptake